MKIEAKIIELLAEYLQKTDRILDRLDKHDSIFEKQFKVMMEHSKQIESLRKETLKHSIHQEEILKEIFSISKRVNTLEEDRDKT
jgi:hypothetical protein